MLKQYIARLETAAALADIGSIELAPPTSDASVKDLSSLAARIRRVRKVNSNPTCKVPYQAVSGLIAEIKLFESLALDLFHAAAPLGLIPDRDIPKKLRPHLSSIRQACLAFGRYQQEGNFHGQEMGGTNSRSDSLPAQEDADRHHG